MGMLPDLALITQTGGFFSRRVYLQDTRLWKLTDCSLTVLSLRCRQGDKGLRHGLAAAYTAGCRAIALAPKENRRRFSLGITDGRLLALSFAQHYLAKDYPGWEKDTLCFNADDNFCCLAARWLSPYSARPYIYGKDAARRQALAGLLYRESGVIADESALAPANSLLMQPPDAAPMFFYGTNETIPCHLAEGLLLLAGGLPADIKPLPLLRLLNHRASYNKILPV